MIRSKKFDELKEIEEAVLDKAKEFDRKIPEIRFFVLNANEFISLLEKKVYPTSPVNIWEGKNVIKKRFNSEIGRDTGIYYEVVQCGKPSYAYLNENNSLTTQASVMSHVIGHCEFSELNVMNDSNSDRTEKIMYLTNKIDNSIKNMGFNNYTRYWNACESVIPLVNANSQYNLENSVETDFNEVKIEEKDEKKERKELFKGYSSTLDSILSPIDTKNIYKEDRENKNKRESISRHGYKLKAPCQDILGFLKEYAPASENEKNILKYMYSVAKYHDFVRKTQIMNEGWAMYWEKKIMLDLFDKKVVTDVVDYCKVFSAVCRPTPFFVRNPYHVGYYMWKRIEDLYGKGKVSLEYAEEKNRERKDKWNINGSDNPILNMEHLVKTITDYEFLRRFLDKEIMEELYLNRMPHEMAYNYGFFKVENEDKIERTDKNFVYLSFDYVKQFMLDVFVDFNRPMIYIIDTDFEDGGLLLYHRHKGQDLRKDWIAPTLSNINSIWKAPVYLHSDSVLFKVSGKKSEYENINGIDFDTLKEKMFNNEKPFILEK